MQGRNSLYCWLLTGVLFTHCSFQGISYQQIRSNKKILHLSDIKNSKQWVWLILTKPESDQTPGKRWQGQFYIAHKWTRHEVVFPSLEVHLFQKNFPDPLLPPFDFTLRLKIISPSINIQSPKHNSYDDSVLTMHRLSYWIKILNFIIFLIAVSLRPHVWHIDNTINDCRKKEIIMNDIER